MTYRPGRQRRSNGGNVRTTSSLNLQIPHSKSGFPLSVFGNLFGTAAEMLLHAATPFAHQKYGDALCDLAAGTP